MKLFDGSVIEELLWSSGFDYQHFYDDSDMWLEVYAEGVVFRIFDTWAVDDEWSVDGDNVEVGIYGEDGEPIEFYNLDPTTEIELVDILSEMVP